MTIQQFEMLFESIADHDYNFFLMPALTPTALSLLAPKVLMMTTQRLLLIASSIEEEVGVRGWKR